MKYVFFYSYPLLSVVLYSLLLNRLPYLVTLLTLDGQLDCLLYNLQAQKKPADTQEEVPSDFSLAHLSQRKKVALLV